MEYMRVEDAAALLYPQLGSRGGAARPTALELAMLVCRYGGVAGRQVFEHWQGEHELTSEALVDIIEQAEAVLRNTASATIDQHDVGLISDGANGLRLTMNKLGGSRSGNVPKVVAEAAWLLRYYAMQADNQADGLRKNADEMRAEADKLEKGESQ